MSTVLIIFVDGSWGHEEGGGDEEVLVPPVVRVAVGVDGQVHLTRRHSSLPQALIFSVTQRILQSNTKRFL